MPLQLNLDDYTITSDPRFRLLADLYPYDPATRAGFVDGDHARGKLERVWFECLRRISHIVPVTHLCASLGQPIALLSSAITALVGAGLARRTEDPSTVEMVGTEERIAWRKQKSVAGKVGASARWHPNKSGTSMADAWQSHKTALANDSLSLSHSLSLSRSPSFANAQEGTLSPSPQLSLVQETPAQTRSTEKPAKKKRSRAKSPEAHADHQRFIDTFTEMFSEARRGARPHWNGRTAGHVAELLKAHGYDDCVARAKQMFASYPTWPAESPDMATLFSHFDKFAPRKPKRPPAGGYVLGADRDQAFYEEAALEVF